jgi:endogenous inhibitor of DNA gyrase (YacG/DUF329 family)
MKRPICKKEFAQPKPGEESFFPFCSDRCKLVDLNRWLTGKYQIPVREDEDEDGERIVDSEQ